MIQAIASNFSSLERLWTYPRGQKNIFFSFLENACRLRAAFSHSSNRGEVLLRKCSTCCRGESYDPVSEQPNFFGGPIEKGDLSWFATCGYD
jgi:hypothetical protein